MLEGLLPDDRSLAVAGHPAAEVSGRTAGLSNILSARALLMFSYSSRSRAVREYPKRHQFRGGLGPATFSFPDIHLHLPTRSTRNYAGTGESDYSGSTSHLTAPACCDERSGLIYSLTKDLRQAWLLCGNASMESRTQYLGIKVGVLSNWLSGWKYYQSAGVASVR